MLLCYHGFCDVSVMLYNVNVTLSLALSKYIDVYPWSDFTEVRGIGRGSSDCIVCLRQNKLPEVPEYG